MSTTRPEPTFDADKRLNPMEAWGVKVMSIGFIVEDAGRATGPRYDGR